MKPIFKKRVLTDMGRAIHGRISVQDASGKEIAALGALVVYGGWAHTRAQALDEVNLKLNSKKAEFLATKATS